MKYLLTLPAIIGATVYAAAPAHAGSVTDLDDLPPVVDVDAAPGIQLAPLTRDMVVPDGDDELKFPPYQFPDTIKPFVNTPAIPDTDDKTVKSSSSPHFDIVDVRVRKAFEQVMAEKPDLQPGDELREMVSQQYKKNLEDDMASAGSKTMRHGARAVWEGCMPGSCEGDEDTMIHPMTNEVVMVARAEKRSLKKFKEVMCWMDFLGLWCPHPGKV